MDFAFHRQSKMNVMLTWPNAPTSAKALVWYDATGGRLSAYARQLVGQRLGPPDPEKAFEQVCGDFWDYTLRTFGRFRRGQMWAALYDYNCILLGNLHALLRLESGAVERWRASSSAVGIEQVISRVRLEQLNACIPEPGPEGLRRAFLDAARLAHEVCAATARANGWSWPQLLAERTLAALGDESAHQPSG